VNHLPEAEASLVDCTALSFDSDTIIMGMHLMITDCSIDMSSTGVQSTGNANPCIHVWVRINEAEGNEWIHSLQIHKGHCSKVTAVACGDANFFTYDLLNCYFIE
jgi:hypothetical protein